MISKYINFLRIYQAPKNILVILPFLMNVNNFNLIPMILTFIFFLISSSFIYIINDYIDLARDKKNPNKKSRALAQGLISKYEFLFFFIFLLFLIIFFLIYLEFKINTKLIIITYLFLAIFYSLFLKKIFILDILIVSFFYVLRIWGGVIESGENISIIIFILTYLISFYILISKRYSDSDYIKHSLYSKYNYSNTNYVSKILNILIVLISILYMYFAFSDDLVVKYGNQPYYFSYIFVLFSLIYYKTATLKKLTSDPVIFLLKNYFLMFNCILWFVSILIFNNYIYV